MRKVKLTEKRLSALSLSEIADLMFKVGRKLANELPEVTEVELMEKHLGSPATEAIERVKFLGRSGEAGILSGMLVDILSGEWDDRESMIGLAFPADIKKHKEKRDRISDAKRRLYAKQNSLVHAMIGQAVLYKLWGGPASCILDPLRESGLDWQDILKSEKVKGKGK